MALAGTLEKDVELKAPAEEFYKIFSSKAHHVPNATDSIHAVEVHEGDWETTGSTKQWSYSLDGKNEVFKEKVHIDDANKTIVFTAVEGHVLEQYKSYKATFKTVPVGEAGMVKITVEYEKLKPDDPPPTKFMDLVAKVVKDVDAHLAPQVVLP